MARKRDDHEKLETLLREQRGAGLVEPPAGVLARAKALRQRLPRAEPTLARRLASLVFDSGAAPLLEGVRSGEAGERRLLYRAGEGPERTEIDLRLRRAGAGSIEVMGQVLPVPASGCAALIVGGKRREARLGEDGEFRIKRVSVADEAPRLELELEGAEPVVVDEMPLPEAP